jgi:hypothetical protein
MPLGKLSTRGAGLYVLEITVKNDSDLPVFVLPECLKFEDSRLDPTYRFEELVSCETTKVEPTTGVNFDIEWWGPLCPQSPFARVEPHSKRTITVFSENRLIGQPKGRSKTNNPMSLSLSVFSGDQRERFRAQYNPPESKNPITAFTQILRQVNLVPKEEPRTAIDVPIEKAAWSNGTKRGEAIGYFFRPS